MFPYKCLDLIENDISPPDHLSYMNMDDILSIIRNDVQCELAGKLCYPLTSDSILSHSLISKKNIEKLDWQLHEDPPLISVCAFYGSIRCFNLLIYNGADINKKDKII